MTKINKKEKRKKALPPQPLGECIYILGRHIRRKWHDIEKKIEKKTYPFIARILHKGALKKVRAKKEPLNVIFMVIHESVWKFDRIYWKMKSSHDFNPIIVICPYIVQGKKVMNRDMEKAFSWYNSRNYNVISSCNNGDWIDVKSQLEPDLIFFTNPHNLTFRKYLAKSYLNVLSVYAPYTHQVSKYMNYYAQYNQISHNTMWKIFAINDMDRQIFADFSDVKGKNVEVTGYPGIDDLIDKNHTPKDVWKKQESDKKKIIWAPHHSIEENSLVRYATFLAIADYMKALSIEFENKIQISLKPHPLLMDKLYTHADWGKKKTDDYFDFWANSSNTQLDLADYTDLFLTSDAMIHDSTSFLAEYLYVNKPVMYMVADDTITERFSPLGLIAFNSCSHGIEVQDIEFFIQNDVLNEQDSNMKKRESFTQKCLLSNTEAPSDIIYNKLVNILRH